MGDATSWSCMAPRFGTPSSSSEMMREGDLVMIYLGHEKVTHIFLDPCVEFENRFGVFSHRAFLGSKWGSKILAKNGTGWVLALAPSPELWSMAVTHRTQIVQTTDLAMITFELGLRDGKVLMEAGTGSGAATVAFARAVAPTGKVHSFEFNEQRSIETQGDFHRMRLNDVICVQHCDVCSDDDDKNDEFLCDAVFLDVPEPWRALPFVLRHTKPLARIACYSPCIEQVQRSSAALRDLGADDIVTIEARLRDFDVLDQPLPPFDALPPRDDQQPPMKKRSRLDVPETTGNDAPVPTVLCAKPLPNMRGHTAFLTFATLPPDPGNE